MKVNIQSIINEITDYINEQNRILQTYGDKKFIGYCWTCQYINIQNDVIEKVCIEDNHGECIRITCEIYVDDYLSDDDYRQEELDELCIVLFDEYDWKMLLILFKGNNHAGLYCKSKETKRKFKDAV